MIQHISQKKFRKRKKGMTKTSLRIRKPSGGRYRRIQNFGLAKYHEINEINRKSLCILQTT
jgi:hypothetical protein